MKSVHSICTALIFLVFVNSAPADIPSIGTILGQTADEPGCELVKCYGQNECKMVKTLCLDKPPELCEKQPLCSSVI